MSAHRSHRLTRRRAKRLLDQPHSVAADQLSRMLGVLAAPGTTAELSKQTAALRRFQIRPRIIAFSEPSRFKTAAGRILAAKVLVTIFVVGAGTGGLAFAAATEQLPTPGPGIAPTTSSSSATADTTTGVQQKPNSIPRPSSSATRTPGITSSPLSDVSSGIHESPPTASAETTTDLTSNSTSSPTCAIGITVAPGKKTHGLNICLGPIGPQPTPSKK